MTKSRKLKRISVTTLCRAKLEQVDYFWLFRYSLTLSIYTYICISSLSSRSAWTDFPDSLSLDLSLSSIAPDRFSILHPVSAQSWYKWALVGRFTLAHPRVGVHQRTLLISLSLLLQQCLACIVRLIWVVLTMGGKWSYSHCFVTSLSLLKHMKLFVRKCRGK